jgi:hypothetical protein
MPHKQLLLRMHEKAPWESRNVYNRDVSSMFNNCLYIESEGVSKFNVFLVFKVRDFKSLMIDKTYSIRLEFRNINESKKWPYLSTQARHQWWGLVGFAGANSLGRISDLTQTGFKPMTKQC